MGRSLESWTSLLTYQIQMLTVVGDFEPSRTRTCDPLVKSQLLYRLSYRPIYRRMSTQARALFQLRRTSLRILPKRDRIVQNAIFELCAWNFVLCFGVWC